MEQVNLYSSTWNVIEAGLPIVGGNQAGLNLDAW